MKSSGLCYICIIILTLISFAGCQQNTSVPQHLIGVWKTSAPKYADRHLKFDEYYLTFGIGGVMEVSHYIQKIQAKQENNEILYTLHYKDSEGEKWTLIFLYSPDDGGTIKLNNQSQTWKMVKRQGA